MPDSDEVELLLQRLAVAEARAVAAEAEAAVAKAATAAAEAATEAADKRTYLASLRGMSASASEASPLSADSSRRGAPEPQLSSVEELLAGFPTVDEGVEAAAWASVCRLLKARQPVLWPLGEELESQPERAFVHALLLPLLQAVTPEERVRLWYEAVLADSITSAEACPDVMWTHSRDANASSLGSLLCLEMKRWGVGHLALARPSPPCASSPHRHTLTPPHAQARTQAASYTRRVVGRLTREADARGDPLHCVRAFSVACVGSHIALVRVTSGAPASGGSFKDAQPCPAAYTEALELLGGWDPQLPQSVAPHPPPGFAALLRLLHAPVELLNACAAPLREVQLDAPPFPELLQLGSRLGSGGFSDIYGLDSGCVLKLPRCSTTAVVRSFAAEAAALRLLARAPAEAVPRLMSEGTRVVARSAALQQPWPALVLSPAGRPLGPALALLQAAPGAGELASAERRAFADSVLRGVLRGLWAAHELGLVHCDVRPSNVVLCADNTAMLVDYGLCRKEREAGGRVGVRSFAADCVWEQGSCGARGGLDLVAAGHSWLSLAYGSGAGAAPPWLARRQSAHQWLRHQASRAQGEEAQHLTSLSLHLRKLVTFSETPVDERQYYAWPWPILEERFTRAAAPGSRPVQG